MKANQYAAISQTLEQLGIGAMKLHRYCCEQTHADVPRELSLAVLEIEKQIERCEAMLPHQEHE